MAANAYLSSKERAILESAVVGIAGAGGLGSNCAMHLVRAGVRHLVIADFDTVVPGNLNRQFFFADQVGQLKVEALRANLLRIEPELELTTLAVKLTAENAGELFAECDIVAEAFDNVESKAMIVKTLAAVRPLVAVSGIAGWGNSNAIKVRRAGAKLILIGDGATGVDPAKGIFPHSPRVGVAAAMLANSIVAHLLGLPL
jgi:sulfur carrier protein ThiS adenylyltransferase